MTTDFMKLSKIAKIEGEGLGTSYEYLTKSRILLPLFETIRPKRVLICGLPEKYGYSMDFVMLSSAFATKVFVLDERKRKITTFKSILKTVIEALNLSDELLKKIHIEQRDLYDIPKEEFDIALSCEVLQRFHKDKRELFVSRVRSMGKLCCLFAPNAKNISHAKISKLNGITLEELRSYFKRDEILSSGYIDCPPNPPGVSFSKEGEVSCFDLSKTELIVAKLLIVWLRIVERIFLRRLGGFFGNHSHMIYVISRRSS